MGVGFRKGEKASGFEEKAFSQWKKTFFQR